MHAEPAQIGRAFARAAATYDAHAALQRSVLANCTAHLANHLKSSCRVLDLGCGTGALARVVREGKLNWNLTGADLALGMCRTAVKAMPVVNADANALPFASASFDAVLSSLTLQWSRDVAAAFAEIKRVLAPNGIACIAIFGPQTLTELKQSFAAAGVPRINAFHSEESLKQAAQQAGLALMQMQSATERTYHTDALELMRSLKSIGATTLTSQTSPRGLATPRQFARVQQAYAGQFSEGGKLTASWEIITLLLRKEAA